MLAERPDVAGLAGIAVPGMPPRSPGMAYPGEPIGGFDVVSFDAQGRLDVYERR